MTRIPATLRDAIDDMRLVREHTDRATYADLQVAADNVLAAVDAAPMPSGQPARLARVACETIGWGNVTRIRAALAGISVLRTALDAGPDYLGRDSIRDLHDAAVDDLLDALDHAGFMS